MGGGQSKWDTVKSVISSVKELRADDGKTRCIFVRESDENLKPKSKNDSKWIEGHL
jgi:hypothetical protein